MLAKMKSWLKIVDDDFISGAGLIIVSVVMIIYIYCVFG